MELKGLTGSDMNKLTVATMQVDALRKQVTDAQATIAALQARVRELEQWVQDQSTANLEMMRHTDEMQSRALEAEQQLTQRTAELEATEKAYQDKTRLYIEQTGAVADLQAELERVSALVKALPKVEGEIAVKETEIDLAAMWGITVNGLFGEHSPLFDTKEEADAYAALLQHRQGMEG